MQRLRGAIEALSEGFALFGEDDRLVLCNARFRSGYPGLEELLLPSLPWAIFLAEAARRGLGRGLDRIDAHLAGGGETPLAVEATRPAERWVRLGFHPTEDGGYVLTETDITAERSAEELRANADELLRDVLDACPSNIMMCRIGDGTIIYRNPSWEAQFGPRRSAREVYADPTARSDFLAELLPTGALDHFETEMLGADGRPFPARISARIVGYQSEQAIVASTQDMSRLYAQRDEIVRINRRLFDAIGALDQGFALFDAGHALLAANSRFREVNAPVAALIVPGVANAALVEAAAAAGHEPRAVGWPGAEAGAEPAARFEFALASGRRYAASRKPTSDGGFVLAWRDVTEQRAAERELARRREASFQSEKLTALGELLAGVAHELNNPLSVVVGQALMLREEADDPNTARRIEKISTAAERCAKIVKTFLAMARQRPARLAPTALGAVVETAADVVAQGIRGAGLALETALAPGLPPVQADEDQITQVVVNLLVNAQQALEAAGLPDGRIRLETRMAPDGMVEAVIADNGPGVPDELRQRIFEPFFTTKDVGSGTGVGLALCHRIVSAHDGRLEVDVGPEGGAAFTLGLPVAAGPHVAPGAEAEPLPAGRLTALVVEDEPEVAAMIAELLTGLGVAPSLANSGEAALERLAGGARFDIVLSDLRMPGMGGRALFREIARSRPDLVPGFAFVTGDAMSRDAEAVRAESGRPLIEKPVAPKELRALLRRLAGERTGREAEQ
ncbi:hybrid sensor histidine kinase/response regulator [Paralimibaculum aggregatum]|nr:PAS-domain containing protein [Limibaculum sp. NKW23]